MKIALITDYLGRFGSKQRSSSYRSGFNLDRIEKLFLSEKCQVKFFNFTSCLELLNEKEPHFILYTSSEDEGEHYKSFIEDTIHILSLSHHICIPNFIFLRAHNNKVFMEMLRIHYNFSDVNIFESKFAATRKEIDELNIQFPIVMKGPSGALSKTVKKANNKREASIFFNSLAPVVHIKQRIKEQLRRWRHRGNYNPEELVRGKIVLQKFVPNIDYDWKVLVYYNDLFVLKRNNRKNDFRASGSGLFSYTKDVPKEILDLAWNTRETLNVPHLSIDIAETSNGLGIFEFQAIYFGTKTLENSTFHFVKNNSSYQIIDCSVELEAIFVKSCLDFLNEKYPGSV